MSVEEKLKKCFKEGEKGKRHKGLRRIPISEEKVKRHLNKAIRNFQAINDFKRIGFSDWSASAAFYSLYHCLLAIIAKYGYESRNQECTFALIEELINTGKISLTKSELKKIFDKNIYDIEHSDKILDIRKNAIFNKNIFGGS